MTEKQKKTKKRFGAPRAKKGELKLQWGKLPDSKPDICTVWGDGAGHNGADSHLLMNYLCNKRPYYMEPKMDLSLIEELEARGYDISTIKFSIQKKTVI